MPYHARAVSGCLVARKNKVCSIDPKVIVMTSWCIHTHVHVVSEVKLLRQYGVAQLCEE